MEMKFDEPKKNDNKDIIINKIKDINPLEITPIEALNVLYELKKEIDDNKK